MRLAMQCQHALRQQVRVAAALQQLQMTCWHASMSVLHQLVQFQHNDAQLLLSAVLRSTICALRNVQVGG